VVVEEGEGTGGWEGVVVSLFVLLSAIVSPFFQ